MRLSLVFLLFFLTIFTSCAEPTTQQLRNSIAYTEFVDREIVQAERVKLVGMVISEWKEVPKELTRDNGDLPGIRTGYYFNEAGYLIGERGDGTTFMRYVYDDAFQTIIQTGWTAGIDGKLQPIKLPDQHTLSVKDWENANAFGKSVILKLQNACAQISAEYKFILQWENGLPVRGKGEYIRNLPSEYNAQGAKIPPKTLYVFLEYEFYED